MQSLKGCRIPKARIWEQNLSTSCAALSSSEQPHCTRHLSNRERPVRGWNWKDSNSKQYRRWKYCICIWLLRSSVLIVILLTKSIFFCLWPWLSVWGQWWFEPENEWSGNCGAFVFIIHLTSESSRAFSFGQLICMCVHVYKIIFSPPQACILLNFLSLIYQMDTNSIAHPESSIIAW